MVGCIQVAGSNLFAELLARPQKLFGRRAC